MDRPSIPKELPNDRISDAKFARLKYGCGLIVPAVLSLWGLFCIVTRLSYIPWRDSGSQSIRITTIHGEAAIAFGIAFIGMAVAFFGEYYAQYHNRMGFYYQRYLGAGVITFLFGSFWCAWALMVGYVAHQL